MKNILFCTVLLFVVKAYLQAQNESPYSVFGYESKTLKTPQERQDYMLTIPNPDSLSDVALVGIAPNEGKYYLFDKDNELLDQDILMNGELGRFLSEDPLTKSYPWYTPYQFAGNDVIRCIDVDGLERYLVVNTYSNGEVMRTTISQVTSDGVVVNMQAVGNGINRTLTLDDILIINRGDRPGNVNIVNYRSQFNEHETAIMNAGVDNVKILEARITVQRDGDEIFEVVNKSDNEMVIEGISFPGGTPSHQGQDLQVSTYEANATMENIQTERTLEVTEKIMEPISSQNFASDVAPWIAKDGISGAQSKHNWNITYTKDEFNAYLIKKIKSQMTNGAIVDKITIARKAHNLDQANSLKKWFEEVFVPSASVKLGIAATKFKLLSDNDNNSPFTMRIHGRKPSTKKTQRTEQIQHTKKEWDY